MKGKASYLIVGAVSSALTVAGIVWLGASDDRDTPTPYADFERDLAAGKIDDVRIDDATYRYRTRGDRKQHKASGPHASLASIAALHGPPDALPPKVWFQR